MSLAFGDERPGGPAKVAIGVATVLLAVAAGGLASDGGGGWALPLLVVGPVYGLFVLWVLVRRRVEIRADRPEVVVTRTLCGWGRRRRVGFERFSGVVCRGVWMRPRGGRPDEGTPEGDAYFIKYEVMLRRGWRVLRLDLFDDVEVAEGVARTVAARIGVPAERRRYERRPDGVPAWRGGARGGLV